MQLNNFLKFKKVSRRLYGGDEVYLEFGVILIGSCSRLPPHLERTWLRKRRREKVVEKLREKFMLDTFEIEALNKNLKNRKRLSLPGGGFAPSKLPS